ncbi:general stress protein [Cytobacillus sp. FJAT-54145]|uniref:General stress protein n=1 Tax=Cytobacillus spartinae TaxID=3299023 RepID=A0ABW6K502_9BACI
MKPTVKEFYKDTEVLSEVNRLSSEGVDKENIYVLSHDDDRTERVADNADVNQIGMKELSLGTTVENIFNKKGDELRNQLEEFGFSQREAEEYEEKLDDGKILLMVAH